MGTQFLCQINSEFLQTWKVDAVSTNEIIPRRPKALWLNREYMLLWSGQVVSSVGTQVSQLAFPLLILALTGSAAQAGFAGALRALPYLFFSLPAGALIDRWDRKLTMIICNSGRAISLASIPIAALCNSTKSIYIGSPFGCFLLPGTGIQCSTVQLSKRHYSR